jgi:L-malate glycosyltransferase
MRVLYVRDAITAHDRRFLKAIIEQGHQPIVALIGDQASPSAPTDVGVVTLSAAPTALGSIAADYEAELAHAGPVPTVAAVATEHLPTRVPLVVVSWGCDVLRDCDREEVRQRALLSLDRASVVLVDCEAVQRRIRDWRPELEAPFVSFPWGVDLARYSRQSGNTAMRDSLGWAANTVLISTRSWESIYGIDVLLAAFKRIVAANDSVRLLLIGDGSLRATIMSQIDIFGLGGRVYAPGRVPESELPAWYATADLYVSSSPCDGTSVSLLEAMASGLPAVVHGELGNTEWIAPDENGWLADCRDPRSLARALHEAIEKRTEWAAMGRANRQRVVKDADWAKNSLRLTEAYQLATRRSV